MRWGRAFALVAVLAAACAPLFPAAAPSPSASPSPIARATPRPTLPPRPSVTATPVRTPRPSSTGKALALPVPPLQTPRPTLALPVVNGSCSDWPAEPAVFAVMTHLALPPSICLLRANADLVGRVVCTISGCVPVTQACADAGSCIVTVESEHPHFVLVWFRASSPLAPAIAEGYDITRYLCQLHQERGRLDAALRGRGTPNWTATVEGTEFASAFASFRTAYPADYARWGASSSDASNYVDVCAAWYYPPGGGARDQRVSAYQPLLTFATKWLPKP